MVVGVVDVGTWVVSSASAVVVSADVDGVGDEVAAVVSATDSVTGVDDSRSLLSFGTAAPIAANAITAPPP